MITIDRKPFIEPYQTSKVPYGANRIQERYYFHDLIDAQEFASDLIAEGTQIGNIDIVPRREDYMVIRWKQVEP